MTISRLSRHVQDVFQDSLGDENVHFLKDNWLLRWKRLQDVLETKKCLLDGNNERSQVEKRVYLV